MRDLVLWGDWGHEHSRMLIGQLRRVNMHFGCLVRKHSLHCYSCDLWKNAWWICRDSANVFPALAGGTARQAASIIPLSRLRAPQPAGAFRLRALPPEGGRRG